MFLCLVAVVSVFAQEIEAGAVPPNTSGEQGSSVTIEVFNDYQCPPCGSMNEELKKVEAKYPNQVLIVYRNYPLVNIHRNAFAAATAAESAALQGKFQEMINLLYVRLGEWSNERDPGITFVSYAKELDLDVERFAGDMRSEVVAERISLDVKRGDFLGVKGTPTVFMNGNKLEPSKQNKLLEAVGELLPGF